MVWYFFALELFTIGFAYTVGHTVGAKKPPAELFVEVPMMLICGVSVIEMYRARKK